MPDLHESNVQTLEIAHRLKEASTVVIEAIDRKVFGEDDASSVLVSVDRLKSIRLVLATQQEAIQKLVERDQEIADLIEKAANRIL